MTLQKQTDRIKRYEKKMDRALALLERYEEDLRQLPEFRRRTAELDR